MSEKRQRKEGTECCFKSNIKPSSTPTSITQYNCGNQVLGNNRPGARVQLDMQSVLHIEEINDTFVTWYVTLDEHVITTMPSVSNTHAQAYGLNSDGYFTYLSCKGDNALVETKYVFGFLKSQENGAVNITVTKFSGPHRETTPKGIMTTREVINVILSKGNGNTKPFAGNTPLFSNGKYAIYLTYKGPCHGNKYGFALHMMNTGNGRWTTFHLFQALTKSDKLEWKHLHKRLEGNIRLQKEHPQSVKLVANSALPNIADHDTQSLEFNLQLNSADERIAAMTIWNAKPENCT